MDDLQRNEADDDVVIGGNREEGDNHGNRNNNDSDGGNAGAQHDGNVNENVEAANNDDDNVDNQGGPNAPLLGEAGPSHQTNAEGETPPTSVGPDTSLTAPLLAASLDGHGPQAAQSVSLESGLDGAATGNYTIDLQ